MRASENDMPYDCHTTSDSSPRLDLSSSHHFESSGQAFFRLLAQPRLQLRKLLSQSLHSIPQCGVLLQQGKKKKDTYRRTALTPSYYVTRPLNLSIKLPVVPAARSDIKGAGRSQTIYRHPDRRVK